MGSKRAMLQNGLGLLLEEEAASAERFVDLFSGSGAVAIYVAERMPIPVLAVDLQHFSSIITSAVLGRLRSVYWKPMWTDWEEKANREIRNIKLPRSKVITRKTVKRLRTWCSSRQSMPITEAYGGHYFSPKQSVSIDALRLTLPTKPGFRAIALASLIDAASQCAAAPGHTAQPFQPTPTALPFLKEAWRRDILERVQRALADISNICARRRGSTYVADANQFTRRLRETDLVFVDPPYSGVHYSRFYHVLESIAQGDCGVVSGVGRYPEKNLRPWSRYSVKSKSADALDNLLNGISSRGAKAILTFPNHECSNGLSGELVRQIAKRHFSVREQIICSRFSTLGGNNGIGPSSNGRAARRDAEELVLLLYP